MSIPRTAVIKSLATLLLSVALTPAFSHAQAGGARGAGAMVLGPQQLKPVLEQLDLTAVQKTKIDGIVKQAQKDAMAAREGFQDATPEERRQKTQDAQKVNAEARTKIEAELTPEQKTKYYPLVASTGLKTVTTFVTALKSAAEKTEATDEQKKQIKDLFDEDDKTLTGLKTDAEAVKDEPTLTDFQKKLASTQRDTVKQLTEAIGQEKVLSIVQAARPQGARARRGGAANDTAPTTQPAAK